MRKFVALFLICLSIGVAGKLAAQVIMGGNVTGGGAVTIQGVNNLLSDGFETGTKITSSTFWSYWIPDATGRETIDTSTVFAGTYSAKFRFLMCGVQNAPTAVTGTTPGGALPEQTLYVKIAYWTNDTYNHLTSGFTLASVAEATQVVAANNLLTITSPAAATGLTKWFPYVTTTSGVYTTSRQETVGIDIGTDWTEPAGGLVVGADVSATNTACGGEHQDDNLGPQRYFSTVYGGYTNGLTGSFATRMYLRFVKDDAATCDGCQRKVFYFKGKSVGAESLPWGISISTVVGTKEWAIHVTRYSPCNDGGWGALNYDTNFPYVFDTWYGVEAIVAPNSAASVADGSVRLLIYSAAGATLYDYTLASQVITGSCDPATVGMNRYAIGNQVDRTAGILVSESRYEDNVVLRRGATPIGP